MSEIPYSTIAVTGPDSFEFLQAQLTFDLNKLRDASAAKTVRSAWCNPKGRVICMPFVVVVDNGYTLTLPSDLVELVMQRLTMFRFRSKVEFEVRPGESSGDKSALEMLQAGIPEIELTQSEKFTPHMLNLDLLEIVSLDKGCYPGQEIIARTHYRGASKRRCLRFKSSAPVSVGDKVSDGQRDIGEVVNAIGTDMLAVVPLDKADATLTIDGQDISHIPLEYLD